MNFRPHSIRMLPVFVIALLVVVGVFGCVGEKETVESDRITVFVSIVPQEFFVQKIGGDRVDVSVVVRPGQSPATYDPTPRQMSDLAGADVYFRIGVGFEKPMKDKMSATLKGLNIVDTHSGIELREIDQHHHEGVAHIGNKDPHIWLSPELVKVQAATIAASLEELSPVDSGLFRANLGVFYRELDSVSQLVGEILEPYKGSDFVVFHPSYGYFADAYGLEQHPIEIAGKEPSAHQLTELVERMRESGNRVVFVQPQFSDKAAGTVAKSTGGRVEVLDPLALDYYDNLIDIASKIAESLSGSESDG